MKKALNLFKSKEIRPGYLYFYIHFIVEVTCFYYLTRVTNNSPVVWLFPLIYDSFAFVPQGLIGYINDLFPKLRVDFLGVILLLISYVIYLFTPLGIYVSLFIICIGNACLHVSGAEVTLKTSGGKLSSPAIFVAGGSFGVITGKVLSIYNFPPVAIIPLILSTIPFIMLAKTYEEDTKLTEVKYDCVNKSINPVFIVLVATFIVIVRGYMGYGIPTSWNKTLLQTVILFVFMGIGKGLGGILSDLFGTKRIGIISTLAAVPFLAFGDNLMIVSLIGVMFFSMTMSITLAAIVSVLKKNPGLAFGFTTVGLFLGTEPIFFVAIPSTMVNIIMISTMSIVCAILFNIILKKETK